MEGTHIGAGLGAVGFWFFITIIVIAGIWGRIRKREVEHETLRRMIEAGQPLDPQLTDKLLPLNGSSSEQLGIHLKTGGIVALFLAPGLALLGWFLGQQSERALLPLLGVAALIACIGLGLMVASAAVRSGRGN